MTEIGTVKENSKELADYLNKEIKEDEEVRIKVSVGESIKEELEFWLQQFKVRGARGHSEWSDQFQRNIWIEE